MACLTEAARLRLRQAASRAVYAYLRRMGHETNRAWQLTSKLVERQLANGLHNVVEQGGGQLRLLVKTDMQVHLSGEPGTGTPTGRVIPAADSDTAADAEKDYQNVPDALSPDQAFDWEWAMTLQRRAVAEIEAQYAHARSRHWFEALKMYVTSNEEPDDTGELEARLNTTESPIRRFVGQLRHRFGNELIREIMETVGRSGPREMLYEERVVLGVLGRRRWSPEVDALLEAEMNTGGQK